MPTNRDAIRQLLDRVRARWLRVSLYRASLRAALAVTAILAVALIVSAWMSRIPAALASLGLAAFLISLAAIVWSLWPMRRRPTDAQVARFIEEREPGLDDRLASAVDFMSADHRGGDVSRLAEPMVADAARRASDVDPSSILPRATLRRRGFQAAAALAVLAIVLFAGRHRARESFDALSLTLFPSRVGLEVTPGNVRIPSGAPVTVRARLVGNQAPVVARLMRIDEATAADAEAWRTSEMLEDGPGAFKLDLKVADSFRYRVVAAGLESPVYEVRVARPPRVASLDIDYTYPASLGLPPRSEPDGGDVYAPAGTEVRVTVHPDGEPVSGRLTFADGTGVDLQASADGTLAGGWKIAANGSYRVALADRDGQKTSGDTEYFIRVIDDRPPEVRILRPARDRSVSPLEEVDVEAQADDDFGIDRVELVYSVRGGAEKSAEIDVPRRQTSVTGSGTIYLEDLGVQPGDFVSYYVRARDLARGRRSTEARSDIFFLEVKPFEQAVTVSDNQGGGGGGGSSSPQLDDLITAQKQIVVATWKLDRRGEAASGAKSAQDIQSVGRAEAELKTRVEETASSFRTSSMRDPRQPRTGRGGAPSGAPRAGQTTAEEEAMAGAAAAMGRAVDKLKDLKTRLAVPPELEALDHLLKAQKDLDKKEISRQQVGTGAGNNRSSQDLSSLFDQELQRQQQTNYETPKSTEEKKPDRNAEMLEKIKDLSARQDELAQRQRDLAQARQKMSPQELTRELQKLTREQNDLRQRAEDLAKQLSQPNRGDQKSDSSQQNQPGQQQAGGQQQGGQQQASGQQNGPGQQRGSGQQSASGDRQPGQQNPGSSGQPGEAMRSAAEEMRNAAGDLSRQDPAQASERSSRALDKLRDLERQMRSSLPDEAKRARGDMQLEARQLAEAERQVESDLNRAGQGEAGRDAMRRAAGEQERLAERAERLQRELERQAAEARSATAGGDQKGRQAVAEAAREFERQKIDERLQQSADALRAAADQGANGQQPSRNPSSPEQVNPQELARALDNLADKLSRADSTGDVESQKLSEQMARAEELREKIDELGRELDKLAQQAQSSSSNAAGQQASADASGRGGQGIDSATIERLRQEYTEQLKETRELLNELGRDNTYTQGGPGVTFEAPGNMTLSAPGTEAFKQDFARWDTLRKQATMALERAQVSISQRLQEKIARDRLATGVDDKPPDTYKQQVDSYFKSLATGRRP